MNFDELSKIVAEEAGVNICPICGVPFDKRHSRQKTCGADECKRLWKNDYLKAHRKKLIEEDADAYREYRNEVQRNYRRRKKAVTSVDETLIRAKEYWERFAEHHEIALTDGKDYAERQIADTLARVPKIDVSGFLKERGNDDLHSKDT